MKSRTLLPVVCGFLLSLACSSDDDGSKLGRYGKGLDGGSGDASSGGGNTGSGGAIFIVEGGLGADGDDGSCGQSVIEAQPKVVNVLVVLDQSGSMVASLGTGDRWTATTGALRAALDDTKDVIDFGLDLFPSEGCDVPAVPDLTVPIESGATGVPKILTALGNAGPVAQGGTPTAAALGRALDYFQTGPGASLEGDRYVLLATDGGPNCNAGHAACGVAECVVNMEGSCPIDPENCCAGDVANCLDDADARRRVEDLLTAGVATFVVGIPGSEDFAGTLDALAIAGGRPRAGTTKYYAVTSAADLADTFRGITTNLVRTCDLQLQSPPRDPDLLNVEIDGEPVPQAGPDGWSLDRTTSPPTINLKGATCTRIETAGVGRVSIRYGCPTIR
jgi:hypothetical protein